MHVRVRAGVPCSMCCKPRWGVSLGQLHGAGCLWSPPAHGLLSVRDSTPLKSYLEVSCHEQPDAGGQQRAQHAVHVQLGLVLQQDQVTAGQ